MSKAKRKIKREIKKPSRKNFFIKEVILPFLAVFALTVFLSVLAYQIIKNNKSKANVKKPVLTSQKKLSTEKLKESLEIVNNLYLDPITLISILDNDPSEIVLIDLRSKEDYKKNHIKSSVNWSEQEILNNLNQLKNKKTVLYGLTSYDPLPKDVALMLLNKGFDVRILAVGWTEFRHFRNLWIPESQWDKVDLDVYIR